MPKRVVKTKLGGKRLGEVPEEFSRAIEAFVRGFSFTRSFTHPYEVRRVGPLWVMRDGVRKSGGARSEEWVADVNARGQSPAQIDAIVRAENAGRFALCAMHRAGEPDGRAEFKALGYRLRTTEYFMIHTLKKVQKIECPAVIERVDTQAVADALAKANGSRQILPEYLDRPDLMRQYIARVDGEIIGWVRSIVVGKATWCSNMYVERAHRRKGIARGLLSRMLADDRASGATSTVLLASHAGAKLYPLVGYRTIGMLLMYGLAKKG